MCTGSWPGSVVCCGLIKDPGIVAGAQPMLALLGQPKDVKPRQRANEQYVREQPAVCKNVKQVQNT
jgi:hypothetical protein